MKARELLDLTHTEAAAELAACREVWDILDGIGEAVRRAGERLAAVGYREIAPGVWAAPGAEIAPGAYLAAPCVVGEGSQVRHGAYIRGNVLIGCGCVVGNSTEVKNAILFDGVQLPHYNYVGDSVLGFRAHLGAGTVVSNLRCDRGEVVVRGESVYHTGRHKAGAVIGDGVEVGCNCVINPGTVIGRGAIVYPLSSVTGVIPAGANRRVDWG